MPATLYLPRRHRRHLLFPPGLLALAGLLWLGCVAVPSMQPVKPQQAVVEVAFPPLRPSLEIKELYYPCYVRPQELEQFRAWYTTTFIGNVFSDYFSLQKTRFIARDLTQKSDLNRGFRVYFTRDATYTNFIQLLDLLNQEKTRKYWIDLYHLPITMYSYTAKSSSEDYNNSLRDFLCLPCGDIIPYIPNTSELLRAGLQNAGPMYFPWTGAGPDS